MANAENIIFQIILHGGNGRSSSMEAIALAKTSDFTGAKQKLEEAKEALNEAHKIQTSLIQGETRGEHAEVSLLMVHAQDHLMNAITLKDIAAEFVDMYETLNLQYMK